MSNNDNRFKYLFIELFSLLLFLFFDINVARASSVLYFDGFDGNSVNSENYDVYLNSGVVDVSNSELKLSSIPGINFPNVHYKGQLPLDNFSIEIRFRFDNLANYGIGAMLGDRKLTNGIAPTLDDLIYYNWGDGHAGHEYRYLNASGEMVRHVTQLGVTEWHTEKYVRSNGINSYYLDSQLIDTALSDRVVSAITFGNTDNRIGYPDGWTSLIVDYLKITTLNSDPFSPYYNQADPDWIGETYDSADNWSPGKQGLNRWGCAVTSAAMALAKYEIRSPNNELTTPKVLNNWLKSESDGYVGNGLVNWLAVARYAKLAKSAGYAPHALEYTKTDYSQSRVLEILGSGQTAIMAYNNHFVLGYGEDGNDWLIADPSAGNAQLLAKSANVDKVGTFTPSNTNLAAMLFVTPLGSNVSLRDSNQAPVPLETESEIIKDDVSGLNATGVQTSLLSKPLNGIYTLNVSGNGVGTWTSYIYDQAGNVTQKEWAMPGANRQYIIEYNPETGSAPIITVVDNDPPPVPTLTYPIGNVFVNTSEFVMDWEDVVDELSNPVRYDIRFSISEGSYGPERRLIESQLFVNNSLDNTTYDWQVRACDNRDNCSNWSPSARYYTDRTAPYATSASTFSGIYTEPILATFNYADANMSPDYVAPTCTITEDGPASTCGITPNVCDRAGNCNTTPLSSRPAMLDLLAPESTIDPIVAEGWAGAVSGTASDSSSGIARVELVATNSLGQSYTATASGTESWSWQWPAEIVPGTYQIEASAVDLAGRVEVEPSQTQVVVVPTVSLSTPKIIWAVSAGRIVTAHWTKVDGATKYTLWYGKFPDKLDKKLGSTRGNLFVGIINIPGTYYLGVRAENTEQVSDFSTPKRFVILPWWMW